MSAWTVADLDRCPHGRHQGDTCAGHRGPGKFDGGCLGGVSLGNPWWRMAGERAGTTIHGEPVTTIQAVEAIGLWRPSQCGWAGCDDAPGLHLLTLQRPCGHDLSVVPSCRTCAMDRRARPDAERATACPVCGETAPIRVVSENLAWETT